MFRKNLPDLDLLESPLISANPLGTMFGAVPGSAIAEKIFNDPESWHGPNGESLPDSATTKDPMAWLAEELEKFQEDRPSPIERKTEVTLRPFSERYKVMPKPPMVLPNINEVHINWEGVQQRETHSHLPIFELSSLELNLDLNARLSKVREAGGNSFNSSPSPVTFPPPPLSSMSLNVPKGTKNTMNRTGVSALNLETIMEGAPSPIVSPVAITSTSTTWSILELYGAPPTPRLDSGRTATFESYPPTPVPPVLRLPVCIQHPPTLQTAPLATMPISRPPGIEHRPSQEMTPVRRLPIIPNLSRVSSSPKPSPIKSAPEPHSRSGSPSVAHPSLNRVPSTSRSPPAGPRARSDTPPKPQRSLDTGFTISPPPSRAHQHSSPVALPPLRYNISV